MWHCHTGLIYFMILSISMPPPPPPPPLKKKRVKHQTLPPWLNTDIKQAMLLGDKCRKQKKFVQYKQQRNRVNYLVREAMNKYFNDLAGSKADISSMWRAINTGTKGYSPANKNLPSDLTPDVFNAHFVSVVSKFLPEDQTDGSQYNCPDRLLNFCNDQISQNTSYICIWSRNIYLKDR